MDAIHNGSLANAEYENFPTYVHFALLPPRIRKAKYTLAFLLSPISFNLSIPKAVPGVPSEILNPLKAWPSQDAFTSEVTKLAGMFNQAFKKYEDGVSKAVLLAGPQI